MDVKKWYNNSEDSDITIVLKSGKKILAHKLILKSKSDVFKGIFISRMKEVVDGNITFPDHSDSAITFVIMSMYGITGDIKSLTVAEWFELFQFANFIEDTIIIENLEKNIHVDASVTDLVTLAFKLSNNSVMNHALREVCNVLVLIPDEQYYENLCEMAHDVYCEFRCKWLEYKLDPYILFSIDCWFSNYNCDDNTMLDKFILTINLTTFSAANFESAKKLPGIKNTPVACVLFDTLYKNKVSSKIPDARSLQHGVGKISLLDVRRNLITPMTESNFYYQSIQELYDQTPNNLLNDLN